jgi:hypothetical protein
VSQKAAGKILKLETNGTMEEIISGLPGPGEISFDPVSGDLIVICDDGKQIVFIGKSLQPPAGGNPGTVGNYFAPTEQPHFLSGNPAITGNRVELNLTGSIIGEFHAVSKRALEGDFDIIVSIDMSPRTLSSGQNRNAVMAVQSNVAGQLGNQFAYIGIYQKTTGWQATGQKYYAYTDTMINGGWGRFNNRAMTDDEPSGMFRIKREGSAITTYYMIGTDWVQLSTTNQGFTDRVRVYFSIDTSWEATLGVDHSAVFNEIVPNAPPAISGTPAYTVEEGSPYSFIPTASDPDGHTLTFYIENKPSWADFDTETGALTGVPSAAHVGSTTGIVISVTDGEDTAALPGFDLTVLGTSSISGRVLIDIAGHTNLPVKNAAVHIAGTDLSADTDSEGYFQLTAIPSGNYSATIAVPGLKSLTRSGDLSIKQNIDLGVIYIEAGAFTQEDLDQELSSRNQTISELNAVIASMYTQEQLEQAKNDARAEIMAVCDPDGNGKIGIEDVIHALNILSAQ